MKTILIFLLFASGLAFSQQRYITNPILRGFNPDPCILRVGDDYYIATSTFQWFPGVQIHHSKDLVHWELLTRPLDRVSQLDMRGALASEGVWAPSLSYSDGLYYLVYTNVKHWEAAGKRGTFNDTPNFLVTAKNITGPWSEPVYLNSVGFDPSLFHDKGGRKWLLGMLWDFRQGKERFAGIVMQEYSAEEHRLIEPQYKILENVNMPALEGPNLYFHNGYYYLIVAVGGTEYWHSVYIARARNITGPYELDPGNPILTSRNNPDLYLQKAGHASLVQTQNGEWYLAHLVGRPLKVQKKPKRRCILGRETALQKVYWNNKGWLRLVGGGNEPRRKVPAPNLTEYKFNPELARDEFNGNKINIHFQAQRNPMDESWISLRKRKGYLALRGRQSLTSLFDQSFIARRLQSFNTITTTALEFEPDNFQQMAGLVCFYDERNYYYLQVTHDKQFGKVLKIVFSDSGRYRELNQSIVPINQVKKIFLRAAIRNANLQFYYSKDENHWQKIGPVLDASILSDEYDGLNFTGAFVGICAQDFYMQRKWSYFDYFEYKEL